MKIHTLSFLTCLILLVHAAYITPTLPSEDDFYSVPENITEYSNGDIIAFRAVPSMIRALYYPLNVVNSWQFLIRSEDSRGNPTAIVTTVIEPYNADPSKVISYQFAQDSHGPNCAPSYAMQFNADFIDSLEIQVEVYLMEVAITRGWFVVIPDYEGLGGAFTAGRRSGNAVLDSVRAALASNDITGIDPDAKVALWGYSGGTIASGWAAQDQPEYAPELEENLIGVAMGGQVSNLTSVLGADGTIFAGFIPLAIWGLLSEYPEYENLLHELTTNKTYPMMKEIENKCLVPAILSFAFQTVFVGNHPLVPEGMAFFDRDDIHAIMVNNTLARNENDGVPTMPVFVFHGFHDELVPVVNSQRVYDNWCDWGIESFEYAVSNTSGHIVEAVEGSGAAIKWIQDRFDGKPAIEGCKKTVRTTNLEYPGVDQTYYWLVRGAIDGLLGEGLGESYPRNATMPGWGVSVLDWVERVLAKIGPIPIKRADDVDPVVVRKSDLYVMEMLFKLHENNQLV